MVIIVIVIDVVRRSVAIVSIIADTFVEKQLNQTREHRLIFIALAVRRRPFNKSFIAHDNCGSYYIILLWCNMLYCYCMWVYVYCMLYLCVSMRGFFFV